MLRLRLARTGRRNQPKYRIVVAEKTEKLNGKVVDTIGHYIPTGKEKILVIDKEAVEKWLSKGVLPSNTVAKLLNTQGFKLAVEMAPVRPAKKAPKEEAPKTAAPAPEAGTEEAPATAEETPVEETPAAETAVETPVEQAPATEEVAEEVATPATEEAAPVEEAPTEEAASDEAAA